MTLGSEDIVALQATSQDRQTAAERQNGLRDTYATSKDMIGLAGYLDKLDDRHLVELVDVTELRLDSYFDGT